LYEAGTRIQVGLHISGRLYPTDANDGQLAIGLPLNIGDDFSAAFG
jgi:hypothetical protein